MYFDLQTLILGVVQGTTEFLPISSSGHLALLQNFWGRSMDGLLTFDLLLHFATVLAVLIFFRKDIASLLMEWLRGFVVKEARDAEGWRYGWAVLTATVATALVAFPLQGAVELAITSQLAVGAGLLLTGSLLFILPIVTLREKKLSWSIAMFVGIAQGFAVFPGISRTGLTIMAGLFLGLATSEAFRFSFLVSIPAIVGATLLEGMKLFNDSFPVLPDGWIIALFTAFILGYFCLVFLRRVVLSGHWVYFGVYCFLLGLTAIVTEIATKL